MSPVGPFQLRGFNDFFWGKNIYILLCRSRLGRVRTTSLLSTTESLQLSFRFRVIMKLINEVIASVSKCQVLHLA